MLTILFNGMSHTNLLHCVLSHHVQARQQQLSAEKQTLLQRRAELSAQVALPVSSGTQPAAEELLKLAEQLRALSKIQVRMVAARQPYEAAFSR
jgi:hypothetical protein